MVIQSIPKALAGYGYKVFSQSDEDGIINRFFDASALRKKSSLNLESEMAWKTIPLHFFMKAGRGFGSRVRAITVERLGRGLRRQ
jgi:hypothetical protein